MRKTGDRQTDKNKREVFIEEYLKCYDAVKAYTIAYADTAKSEKGIRSNSYRVLNDPDIQAAIQKRRKEIHDAMVIDTNRVLENIAEIAFNPENSKRDRLSALSLLTKTLGMESTTQNVNVSSDEGITINITGAENEQN